MKAILKSISECRRIDIIIKSKIDLSVVFSIEDVISLLLCKILSEMCFHVILTWMTLNREVSPVKSIKEIETDREISTKPAETITQQSFPIKIHKAIERNFEQLSRTLK